MIRQWLKSVLMFFWLVVGYAAVHGTLAFWACSIVSLLWPSTTPREHLVMTKDGEPLIQSYVPGGAEVQFRRLDGTYVTDKAGLGKSFINPSIYVYLYDPGEPVSWRGRLASFVDFRKPATFWYFVAPPNRESTAYFVGFDRVSRRIIGYLGINGFSPLPPTVAESFPIISARDTGFHGLLASGQPSDSSEPSIEQLEYLNAPLENADLDTVWVLARGTVYEVHLGDRTVKVVLENHPEWRSLTSGSLTQSDKRYLQLLARSDKGYSTIDPRTGEIQFAELPVLGHQSYESLYDLGGGRRVIAQPEMTDGTSKRNHTKLAWLNAAGQVERTADAEMFRYSEVPVADPGAALSVCMPIPLVSLGACVCAPVFLPRTAETPAAYHERCLKVASDLRMWVLTSVIIGFVAGWACRRRQRDVFNMKSWFWPVVVGICGLFGWIAYICIRPLPARLPQGGWLGTQPQPVRALGTEIYA